MSTTLASLADLADLVLLQLPGCPYALALDGLKHAARDLCRRAGVWREDVEVTTVADTLEYALDLPEGAYIEALADLKDSDGNSLGNGLAHLDPPAGLTFEADPGAGSFTAVVICTPSGSEVPDWLVQTEADTLRAGALAVRRRDTREPWAGKDWPVQQAQFDEGVRRLAFRRSGAYCGRSVTALQGVRVL